MFCAALRIIFNFQCVLLNDSNYRVELVRVAEVLIFYSAFNLIDDAVVDSDSEDYFWSFMRFFLS